MTREPIITAQEKPDGDALVNQLDAAAEELRAALHTLTGMKTGDLYPSEWSRQLYRAILIQQRLEQLIEHLGRRFFQLRQGYPYEVLTDNGAAVPATLSRITLTLAAAKRGLAPVGERLTEAFEKTETLKLDVPDDFDAEDADLG